MSQLVERVRPGVASSTRSSPQAFGSTTSPVSTPCPTAGAPATLQAPSLRAQRDTDRRRTFLLVPDGARVHRLRRRSLRRVSPISE
jgi:hypothetical protein